MVLGILSETLFFTGSITASDVIIGLNSGVLERRMIQFVNINKR